MKAKFFSELDENYEEFSDFVDCSVGCVGKNRIDGIISQLVKDVPASRLRGSMVSNKSFWKDRRTGKVYKVEP